MCLLNIKTLLYLFLSPFTTNQYINFVTKKKKKKERKEKPTTIKPDFDQKGIFYNNLFKMQPTYVNWVQLSSNGDHASCTRTYKHTGDWLLETKTYWIYINTKGRVFQPRVLQLNLDNIIRLLHSKHPDRKKLGNLPTWELNTRPSAQIGQLYLQLKPLIYSRY